MNSKAIGFIKNFSYTIFSNLISLIISTLVTLIVPKMIGVQDYGFWQLYILYVAYVGFFHLGWVDGVYLRYGGERYEDLDKKNFFSQFISLFIFQLVATGIVLLLSFLFIRLEDRLFIFCMIALNIVAVNIRYFFLYILQATNRIKEYAIATMIERIIFIFLIIVQLIIGLKSYQLMVTSDLIGKIISMLYLIWLCKDIVFQKFTNYYVDLKEIFANISAGSKLLLANLASNLIIGIVRFGIEMSWDVSTFGKVSLTLSISHFLLIFISGIATIIYPIFRRIDLERLASIYNTIKDFLNVISFALLIFYYPFKVILSAWLPQYSDSLIYMALLFPMVVYEGKIALLINTYLKTLRKEKVMLKINLLSLVFSGAMTIFTTVVFKNLNFAVLTILLAQVFRATVSEIYLSKALNISLKKDMVIEIVLTLIFILSGWYISSWMTMLVYGSVFVVYLLIKKRDLMRSIKELSLYVKK